MLLTLALYMILGGCAGLVAGLFGIGGGILIVPVLILSFTAQGVDPAILTHSAVATSLATIVFTSIASIRAHHRKGAVHWRLAGLLTVGIVGGALFGVWLADRLSGPLLQTLFGCFALAVAVQMAFELRPPQGKQAPSVGELAGAGGVIGCASALFGIGGGTLSVPYLHWRSLPMAQAVATSAACGLPIAIMGALGNIISGWNETALSEGYVGYIFLPAFAGIVVTSAFTARLGAHLAHSLPQRVLKRIFALLLLIVGLRFLFENLA
ncbi:MAG: sulfite exporter TauE/SafE family protein [Oceanospirillaceae bacterium]|jgi:uncharacterized membrane protein YfcA|uniref:sulfite exporter TauE/SafE family protein n=1 Tax=Marinobacterium litorale TaxID=404770 RepID=UPI00041F70C1|nr:sulfite exporter TauE/SafE family protein [Marinobacterium litorale]MBS99279.1 sulfite exporter TauE/SafE family protein [Oceanospirillaceae bacterium]